MAPGSATLVLKAAAVASILAMMVLPSLGRCPSLGPEPPVAAPAPGPGPAMRCDDCGPHCISTCRVSVPPKCSKPCGAPSCDECRSAAFEKCSRADCDGEATRSCYDSCSNSSACADCTRAASKQCSADCNSHCAATCF
ncbi:hypothetical protein CFC21_063348 [Triticum aestivum]|uniref:Bowman-Birk serine protease inhibitors family domain-containing protein n=2 Tax=Triticum aestivum TaxID=4565 RepID=A0A9R1KJ99_WHEAT|nr:hypothetical protein CFC21_063348 [Triticum aestivum]